MGVASLVRNCLRDELASSRSAALLCCRNAIVTGFALGDGAGDAVGGGSGGGDGLGAILGLSFCGAAWTAELAGVLRSNASTFEDKERAVEALAAMAAFGSVEVLAGGGRAGGPQRRWTWRRRAACGRARTRRVQPACAPSGGGPS